MQSTPYEIIESKPFSGLSKIDYNSNIRDEGQCHLAKSIAPKVFENISLFGKDNKKIREDEVVAKVCVKANSNSRREQKENMLRNHIELISEHKRHFGNELQTV